MNVAVQGKDGHLVALSLLQRCFRLVLARLAQQRREQQRAAVAVVSATWAMRVRARALRRKGLARLGTMWTNNEARVEEVLGDWDTLTASPHVVVLLLSISGSKALRQK
jgi:hypothetical protein